MTSNPFQGANIFGKRPVGKQKSNKIYTLALNCERMNFMHMGNEVKLTANVISYLITFL